VLMALLVELEYWYNYNIGRNPQWRQLLLEQDGRLGTWREGLRAIRQTLGILRRAFVVSSL